VGEGAAGDDRTRGAGAGASPSLFGSYALGGALSILTRRPAGDELGLEAGYGKLETTRLNAAGALRQDAFDLGANVNYFDTAGYVKLAPEERGAADIASAAHSLNAQTRLQYRPRDAFDAFARANYFQNHQDLETRFSENERRIFDLAAGFHRTLDADSRVSGSLFYEHNRFETTNTDFVTPDSRDEDYVSNVHETPTDDLGEPGRRPRDAARSGGRLRPLPQPGPRPAESLPQRGARPDRLAALPGGAFLVVWTERTGDEPTRWISARVGGS